MANSDNYTKFPNDILDAVIRHHFTASQMVVILYVIRKVNGWNKKSDAISINKMAKDTGYSRRWITDVVFDLEGLGVLEITHNGNGRLSEMKIANPKKWRKPVNCTSQGTVLHRGVNSTSQVDVNSTSQVPENCTSHTKERKERKDTKQKKEPFGFIPNNTDISQEELDEGGWGFE